MYQQTTFSKGEIESYLKKCFYSTLEIRSSSTSNAILCRRGSTVSSNDLMIRLAEFIAANCTMAARGERQSSDNFDRGLTKYYVIQNYDRR